MLQAKLERKQSGCYVEVKIGETDFFIFESLMEHCCKNFSITELLDIQNQIEEQIKDLSNNDIIPSFLTIIEKIKEIIKERQNTFKKLEK